MESSSGVGVRFAYHPCEQRQIPDPLDGLLTSYSGLALLGTERDVNEAGA